MIRFIDSDSLDVGYFAFSNYAFFDNSLLQIDSQKEQIRAEDREKGVYHLAVDETVRIPRAGKQAVL